MRATRILNILALTVVLTQVAAAQPRYKGVVWDPPDEQTIRISDLHRMRAAGVNAIRTRVLSDTLTFTIADSLGIQFFQDLPLFFLPAPVFVDSVESYLDANLDRIVDLSVRYTSARTVGISIKSDTSDPDLCTAMNAAAARIADASAGRVATYYVTEFLDSDKCANSRVFTIYGRSAAERLVQTGASNKTVGVTVGHQVVHGRTNGWRHEHSEEQQARQLENALGSVFADPNVAAVFVNRWTDDPAGGNHDSDALNRDFGILGTGGVPTLSLEVVSGFYNGTQQIFAIDAGTEREISRVWLIVLGWILFGSVATAYAFSPQMRQMAPRYFLSHGFYRESVAEGRDAIPVASLVMLAAIAVSAGLIGTVIVSHFAETRLAQAFVYNLPNPLRGAVPLFVTQPALLCILIACLYALFMTSWTSLLSLWSRFGTTLLLPWQTLLLVVWPRWPILLVMMAALSVGAGDPTNGEVFVICGATIGTALMSIYRSINDYRHTAGLGFSKLIVPLMLNPSLVLLTAAGIVLFSNQDTAEFLIHLLLQQ